MVSTSYPPAVIAGPPAAPQIPHDAELAPIPYTGRNSLRKFLAQEDSNQRASCSMDDALDHVATVRGNYSNINERNCLQYHEYILAL